MKKTVLWLLLSVCFILSGCSGLNEAIEKQIFEQAGIAKEDDYQRYQSYYDGGKLTPEGYYSDEEFGSEEMANATLTDTAHISFAKNSYLDVKYYTDPDCTIEITGFSGDFKTGDEIYVAVKVNKDVSSSMYSFEGFRLYKFVDNERELMDVIQPSMDGLLLTVDEELMGMDLLLEPIGDYVSRMISLRDYYTDVDGNEYDLSGTWLIDDKEITEDTVAVNPVASYIISYEYDNDEYFYISSSPESFYINHEDGVVIFELMDPTDESYDYVVQLHKYLTVHVESSVDRSIVLNDSVMQELNGGSKFDFKKLKYGDKLKLVTDKEWPQLEMGRELIVTSSLKNNAGMYEYDLIVPQKGSEFVFDPKDYSYEHGTIIFKCFGETVTSTQYLAKGTPIQYSAGRVDKGYWLPENNRSIIVGEEEETRAALRSICFVPETKVTVNLPQPSFGGKIRYYVDGKEIKNKTYQTASGAVITMRFEPWPGWINNYMNGEKYRVNESLNQVIKIKGNLVDAVFAEDAGHKPKLEVVLDKSVGENMKFSVSASGIPKTDGKYESGWIGSSKVIIAPTPIGTETGIQLTMGNRSLQADTALKILVEKQDTNGNKYRSYRLVNNLAEKQDLIPIYPNDELGVSEVWYKTVKITISVVEVQKFSAPDSLDHATVSVRLRETQQILEQGDLLEPYSEVMVTITPDKDYYVTGSDVKNDIYQDKMKFSNYQKNIQRIIAEHPVERYVHVNLKTHDPYGNASYTVGKSVKSGSIRLKVGDELKIHYAVTADGYVIESEYGEFLKIGPKIKEVTKTIPITHDWDGKMINRSSFGINVVKGE